MTPPLTEIVHYVRAYRMEDGSWDECPAIVCGIHENGAFLHLFEDRSSGRHAAPPLSRTHHDPDGAMDTWHLASECKLIPRTEPAGPITEEKNDDSP